jgi:hypothetical protein
VQIEAAAMLHFCLVDQNHFSRVLSSMDPGDKDNVLHRVTTEKHRRNSHRPKKCSQSPLSNGVVNDAFKMPSFQQASASDSPSKPAKPPFSPPAAPPPPLSSSPTGANTSPSRGRLGPTPTLTSEDI